MSQGILSPPAGLLSDEEVVVSPMFESTAADLGCVVRKNLSDCSVISTSLEDKQQVKELESGLGAESDILSLLVVHTESSIRSLVLKGLRDQFKIKSMTSKKCRIVSIRTVVCIALMKYTQVHIIS